MHVAAWLCVAAIASIYLYGLITGSIGGQAQLTPQIHTAQPASGGIPTGDFDSATLAGQVELLRREINALKQRERLLETRVADLQSALGPMTSSLANSGPAPVAISRSALPGSGFGDGIDETSAIPIASVSQPTRTMFAIELGQDPSLDGLRRRWRGLLAKHNAELKDLEIRYVAIEPESPKAKARLKLIAGPFSNAADAATVCAKLKARRRSCLQTTFVGKKVEEETVAAENTIATPDLPDRKPSRRRN